MKNNFKKIISVFLMVTILTGVLPISGMAEMSSLSLKAEAYEDDYVDTYPLRIDVTSNKSKYGVLETATISVSVANIGENAITDMNVMCDFAGLQPVGNPLSLYIDNETLYPNEQISYCFEVVVEKSNLNFFLYLFMLIKSLFTPFAEIPYLDVDDNNCFTSQSFTTLFGNMDIESAINVWFDYETEIIATETSDDFSEETSKLVSATMNAPDFDIEEAIENPYSIGRVIVKTSDDVDFSSYAADKIITDGKGTTILQFGSSEMAEYCVESLNEQSAVDFAEPDGIVTIASVGTAAVSAKKSSSDLSWGEEYIKSDSYSNYLENINRYDMITVAVVDTGVDLDHPYLSGKILSSGYDWIDSDVKPDDENGHGTHVAGIIADNTNGLNVKILPYRCLNRDGNGSVLNIANAIEKASESGADIINLSLGGSHSKYLDDAIQGAIDSGMIVCVAAGNGDEKTHVAVNSATTCPAHIEDAVVVGAIDKSGKVASFSNYGESVDVVAPGVSVYSSYLDGNYASLSGTSMATPHISAVAAMFKLAYSDYTPAQIESLIKDYCIDLGTTGRDDYYGYGSVDMYNAIPDCVIKFNLNGGAGISRKTQKSTTEITLPTPTKSYTVTLDANGGSISQKKYTRYCTLDGWYKSSNFSGLRYAPDSTYIAKTNETLYAKWINPDFGSVNQPTRQYYDFAGWYTSSSGGSEYTSGTDITENITLYAHWTRKTAVVPNVIGTNYSQAKSVLESKGLIVQLASATNSNYAKNIVFAQSIGANQTVNQGSTITLTYSTGSKPIEVGDYVSFNGGTYLYKTIAGGPKNGVYKAEASGGYITGIYVYSGTTYYQFKYYGASDPFGWAPASYFTQLS